MRVAPASPLPKTKNATIAMVSHLCPRALKYVDETKLIVANYGNIDDETDEAEIGAADGGDDVLETEGGPDSQEAPYDGFLSLTDARTISIGSLPARDITGKRALQSEQENRRQAHFPPMDQWSSSSLHSPMHDETSPDDINPRPPGWMPRPANDLTRTSFPRDRAILLRYFVQELSLWFDICDPQRHFGQIVPRRARTPPTLSQYHLHSIRQASCTLAEA
ncbi:uncharacterized protein Z518_11104 [Rhinocladiella mackenziei CBS 650.93]|uniref:Uncharacterized protein n=1 Tax=Rhinocladiella mackenziei CBS 650.93 TaxID=1442369 RepID=A0A0D2FC53_9EURO|nr:uncharacterized protein Z518_11104 [Rhinocladiella mackenziei CBS 650.93]KIW99691.1 hypothetical protein Z518_11104 [Rhinocladiella mackenziei CBS 650.93]